VAGSGNITTAEQRGQRAFRPRNVSGNENFAPQEVQGKT
jgi:hypothetical protein